MPIRNSFGLVKKNKIEQGAFLIEINVGKWNHFILGGADNLLKSLRKTYVFI